MVFLVWRAERARAVGGSDISGKLGMGLRARFWEGVRLVCVCGLVRE